LVLLGVGYRHGVKVTQGEWDASVIAGREAQDKALRAAAESIAKITVTQQTIVQKVQHEVKTQTVYRDCIIPADGRGLLNAAIAGASVPPGGDGMQAPAE
jgi:ribosomal protein S5